MGGQPAAAPPGVHGETCGNRQPATSPVGKRRARPNRNGAVPMVRLHAAGTAEHGKPTAPAASSGDGRRGGAHARCAGGCQHTHRPGTTRGPSRPAGHERGVGATTPAVGCTNQDDGDAVGGPTTTDWPWRAGEAAEAANERGSSHTRSCRGANGRVSRLDEMDRWTTLDAC